MRRFASTTYRGRGFYLLAGTLCAMVIMVMVACCTISVLTIGRATQQESEAIDSALMAFDLYQQERTPSNNTPEDAIEAVEVGGALEKLASDPANPMLRNLVAQRIAPFEKVNAGDVSAVYVVLENGACILGSADPEADARTYDARLSLLSPEELSPSPSAPQKRLLKTDGATWQLSAVSYQPGTSVVVFYHMPQVPNLEVLAPIADITEMYFLDHRGTWYAFGTSDHAAALDYAQLETGEPSGIVAITAGGTDFRVYFHNLNDVDGTKFVMVVPDVAQMSFRQFATTIVIAGIALVALGCVLGLYLTQRIYQPLQHIIERLTPEGRDVGDEFKLIGFALEAMENQLSEQSEVVSEFHLMRLLRGRARLEDEGVGFFFAEPNRAVALAAVRSDDTAHACDPARLVREFLAANGRTCALCEESGFVFAVVDGQGGGVMPLMERFVAHAREQGVLLSAFVSDVHAGSAKLNLCYREVLGMIERATKRGTFNAAVGCAQLVDRAERPHASGTDVFADMIAYVQANYRDPELSCAQLASHFGVSRTVASRLFAQSGAGGFLDYLHGLRIAKATELLRATELSVADVATSVGYTNALTMTRAFKRYLGTTPGAYRESPGDESDGNGAGDSNDPADVR